VIERLPEDRIAPFGTDLRRGRRLPLTRLIRLLASPSAATAGQRWSCGGSLRSRWPRDLPTRKAVVSCAAPGCLHHALRSTVPTARIVTAPSRMEQSARVGAGCSQVVLRGSGTPCRLGSPRHVQMAHSGQLDACYTTALPRRTSANVATRSALTPRRSFPARRTRKRCFIRWSGKNLTGELPPVTCRLLLRLAKEERRGRHRRYGWRSFSREASRPLASGRCGGRTDRTHPGSQLG
jgi:hypothetical protein